MILNLLNFYNKTTYMKYFKLYILINVILILSISQIFAQAKKIAKADELRIAGDYYAASEIYIKYQTKLKDKKDKAEVAFNLGECYRNMNDPKQSSKWYKKAVTANYQNPLAYLYLADAQKMRGEFEDALANYASYKDIVPSDSRGEDGITSCKMIKEWMANPERYLVAIAPQFNGKQADFAAAYAGDSTQLYFTSARETSTGDDVNGHSGMFFTDIFYVQKDKKGKWSEPVPATGSINTVYDEGACTLTENGLTMYYMSCPVEDIGKLGCKIYKSESSDGTWGEAEEIVLFADSSISVGHPFITSDELTLYFAAEHPEKGIGGKDIWKITRKSKSADWGSPEVLGTDINTEYNELYPSEDSKGNLYFASDGYIGMGGLDIYKATPNDNDSYTVENMKYPINSTSDDFRIIFNGTEKNGYFSTTRTGTTSDDIYYFWEPPLILTIQGKVYNDKNNAPIVGVTLKMTGSNGNQLETVTAADGSFYFDLKENTDYFFEATKTGYFKGTSSETTKGLDENTTLKTEIYIIPDEGTIQLENIFYTLGDTTLREESKISLEELVKILSENPTYKIELMANTDFRGSDESNMKLSQGRANSVVAFLIEKGIPADRLVPKGYGEVVPFVVDEKTAEVYTFLKVGDILDEKFIIALKSETDKEIAHQLNRRTEFKVLSKDYGGKFIRFGED